MKFSAVHQGVDKINHVSKVLIVSYFPVCLLVVFITPNNILDFEWASSFANFSAGLIPLIAKIGRITILSELYFSAAVINLIAITYTLLFIYFAVTSDREYFFNVLNSFSKFDKIKMVFPALFSVLAFLFILFDFQPGASIIMIPKPMVTSRLGMGIYGSIFFGVWYAIVFTIYIIFILLNQSYRARRN